ncbi:MAG: sigma-54 dependent transcriptional regulator [Coprothermobacterota bacterium]|nr:sigma-54 dependent transcriptional regulator [Coprothermobacterota bacterium]
MSKRTSILVIDDDLSISMLFGELLGDLFQVIGAKNGKIGLQKAEQDPPDLVFLDLRLPDMDGEEILSRLRASDTAVPVIVLTGFESVETAVAMMKLGAYDYLPKPLSSGRLPIIVEHALEKTALEREIRDLKRDRGIEGIIGSSPQIEAMRQQIRKVAPYDVAILLVGESGTGKELAAKAIHDLSPRHQGPFVAVDCNALPETLFESELFGYERGAFTGADQRKIGRFELASGGTFFLDEISNLPLAMQTKLLRVLQEKMVERLGGRAPHSVDIRLVTATNADLEQAMRQGRFREDLYFRIQVLPITIPPLRDRQGDIPLLARYFLDRFRREFNRPIERIRPEAIDRLQKYPWPGNVRELENAIKSAVILADREIDVEHLPLILNQGVPVALEPGRLAETEREAIRQALEAHGWNRSRTAKFLGIDEKTLRNKIHKYELKQKPS